MWQSPPSNVKMAGCRTLKETLRSHWERGRLAPAFAQCTKTPHTTPVLKYWKYPHICIFHVWSNKKTLSNINNIIFFVFCAKFCNIICTFAVWKQIAKCMHFYRECERVMVCDWDRERLYYCISYLFPKCSLGSMVLLILLYLKSDALHIYNVHANVTHSVWIWL